MSAGIPATELESRRERLLDHARAEKLSGYVLFGPRLHPVLHELQLPLQRAPDRVRAEHRGRDGDLRPGVRGRARARRDIVRAHRVVSRVSGHRASDADLRAACSRISASRARSAPTRTAIRASSATRAPPLSEFAEATVSPLARADRVDDGAEERDRDRAHPRERALVRARASPAPGVLGARRDGSRGEPARGLRDDTCDGGGARRARPAGVVRRRVGRLPRADRRAQCVGARGGAQHRVRGGRHARHRDECAGLGLQRRARARHGHRRRRPTRCAGCSTMWSRRSRSRSTRSAPASRAPTSTAR